LRCRRRPAAATTPADSDGILSPPDRFINTFTSTGDNDLTHDFGFDFVWLGHNGDGVQTGETTNGIANVTVQLFNSANIRGRPASTFLVAGAAGRDRA
jgi:hypothetical protein